MGDFTFRPRRVSLSAGVSTAVYPPTACRCVLIGNATPDDLLVYDPDDPGTGTFYFIVAAGYEKAINLNRDRFEPNRLAFNLKAVQAGTAVLVWL